MRKDLAKAVLVSIALVMGTLAVTSQPAMASGSVIDIGYTIVSGGYIKGSGSDTNNGDYTNVCVVIMEGRPGGSVENRTKSCRSNSGSNTWSAPDYRYPTPGRNSCTSYYTRITAYRNGSTVANKNSNVVKVCNYV